MAIFKDMIINDPEIRRILERLHLEPLPREGGYFRRTYEAEIEIPGSLLGATHGGSRAAGSAIYYLITPESHSALHRLPSDELWHFYAGDPIEQLRLMPDGSGEVVRIGTDWDSGCEPQVLVPAGVWQGTRLVPGGRYALVGNTVHPGFEFEDYEHGDVEILIREYPRWKDRILDLGGKEAS